jgi:diacylglycerol kinase family enzyme
VRQELVDPPGRVGLHAKEHVGEVVDGVDAVRLAGGDGRVAASQVLAGLVVSDEQEVFPFMQSSA